MKTKSIAENKLLPVLIVLIFAAGCSNKSTNADKEALNQATSMEIFSYLIAEAFTMSFSTFKSNPDLQEFTIYQNAFELADTQTISQTLACDQGGSINVTGTYTSTFSDEGTGSYAMQFRQKPVNCVIPTSQGAYTVNGNPDLIFEGYLQTENWQFVGTYTYSIKGGYNWNGPSGSGGCSIDISYTYNWQTQKISISGSMCGYTYT